MSSAASQSLGPHRPLLALAVVSDDLARLRHSAGESEVFVSGQRITARVTVEDEDSGGVDEQRGGRDAARLAGGAGQRADLAAQEDGR